MCGPSAENCLRVGAALAHSIPARVLDQVSATELLRPQSLMQAAPWGTVDQTATFRFIEQTVPALRDLQKVHAHSAKHSILVKAYRSKLPDVQAGHLQR